MLKMFTRSHITTLSILYVIVLAAIIVPAEGHAIRTTRDTIQSDHHLKEPSNNEKTIDPNVGETFSTEGDDTDIETFQSATDQNVDIVTLPKEKTEPSSTTDVNNNIEHRSETGKHIKMTANVDKSAILEPLNETVTTISATNSNSTKDISHDSMENRLPSNSNEETTESISTSEKNVKQTLEKLSADGSISFVPLDKTKRLDTSIQNATQRAANLVDTTTENNKSSLAPSHVSQPEAQTPRIMHATDTIRARVSSEQLRKQAKFLNDSNSENPTSAATHHSNEGVTDTWANIKTVNEVHHNNFTSVQSNDPIKSVSGKLDQEELENAKTATEPMSTERVPDDHETQLQKQKTALNLNASRIDDHVQQDNSLTAHQSASEGPTNLVPVQIPTLPQVDSHRNESSIHIPVQNAAIVSKSNVILQSTPKMSATMPGAESVTESINVTEDEIPSTTENELTTTISSESNETIMPDSVTTTTTSRTIHAMENATKTKEKMMVSTESQAPLETSTTEPETTTFIFTTSKENIIPEATPRQQQEDHSEKAHIVTRSTTISPAPEDLNVTSVEMTKSHATSSHRPIISTPSMIKSNETNGDLKVITNEVQSTRKMPEQKPTSTSTTTTTTVSPSTSVPELPHGLNPKKSPTSTEGSDTKDESTKEPTLEAAIGHQNEIGTKFDDEPADINAIIAITISIVAVITLILLVGFLFVMRKRQKQLTYGQRCRPIGLDAYSLDNVSVYNSVRRKSAMRTSKRAFGNAGFDDPGLKNHPLSIPQLATFSTKRVSINDEFRDIPMVTARIEEVPIGCEDKNRYANVVPLPESRVHLKQLDDDEKTEYINANFVKGPKDTTHYYIVCQAPLEHTVTDFWRMIWEQNSRVIIMATDLTENGIEKCAEYLPSSFVIDNHVTFGDYQIILKNREVRDKYAVSTVHLKNACTKTWREITHFWYQWPDNGVPTDEASVIAMLLEARSYLKTTSPERYDAGSEQESLNGDLSNGNSDKSRSLPKVQGPLVIHCSPGTGRSGTIVSCDIAIRSLEQPARMVDIPQIVYFVRRGRASAVQTREQYEYIYKIAHVYATKLTGPIDN